MLPPLLLRILRVLLVYSLPWGFAFEVSSLLIHSQGHMNVSSPGESTWERGRDILLYSLSLVIGGVVWAFSYVLAIAALHQGVLIWLSLRLAWGKGSCFAGHLGLGIMTGVALFHLLKLPRYLPWMGFDYYTPPLALPGLISCVVASACAGLYSLRKGMLVL